MTPPTIKRRKAKARGRGSRLTSRGFKIRDFKDDNGIECNIQKSSSAMRDCIWLGAKDIGLQRFTPGRGWEDVSLERTPLGINHIANNRMHLSRANVRRLLPILRHFVDTGDLP